MRSSLMPCSMSFLYLRLLCHMYTAQMATAIAPRPPATETPIIAGTGKLAPWSLESSDWSEPAAWAVLVSASLGAAVTVSVGTGTATIPPELLAVSRFPVGELSAVMVAVPERLGVSAAEETEDPVSRGCDDVDDAAGPAMRSLLCQTI